MTDPEQYPLPEREPGEKPRTTAEAAGDLERALRTLFDPLNRWLERVVDRLATWLRR